MAKTEQPTDKQGRRLRSDLDKVDVHVITAEEYGEIPELMDEDFARGDIYHGDKLIKRGRRNEGDEDKP